jgi:hypothetical protein
MALTIDAMHDEEWTRRAVAGWEMELGKPTSTVLPTTSSSAS